MSSYRRKHPFVPKFAEYQAVAFLPITQTWVVRHGGNLEAWQPCPEAHPNSIDLDGQTLHYQGDIDHAYRIVDSQRNRDLCPERIGEVTLEKPTGADLQEIKATVA